MTSFPSLLTPILINHCRLANRIMLPAAVTRLAGADGTVTEALIQRKDAFGGDLSGRMSLPLMVVRAVRKTVGPDYPMGVRINGEDFTKNGNTVSHSRRIALILAGEGVDYLSFSVRGGALFQVRHVSKTELS